MSPAALQRQWYATLREQGFVDIETGKDGNGLISNVGGRLTPIRMADHEALTLYFTRAREFLETHRFQSNVQRRIWELHSEGVSIRRISSRLRTERLRAYKSLVEETITKLRAVMLNPKRLGRPPRPGGLHRDSAILTLRLQDGLAEGLQYLVKRWGVSQQEIVRRLIEQAARIS